MSGSESCSTRSIKAGTAALHSMLAATTAALRRSPRRFGLVNGVPRNRARNCSSLSIERTCARSSLGPTPSTGPVGVGKATFWARPVCSPLNSSSQNRKSSGRMAKIAQDLYFIRGANQIAKRYPGCPASCHTKRTRIIPSGNDVEICT